MVSFNRQPARKPPARKPVPSTIYSPPSGARKVSKASRVGYTQRGWYVAGKTGFPRGAGACQFCRKSIAENDVVYAFKITLGDYMKSSKIVVIHKACYASPIGKSPWDEYDKIKARVDAGGSFFE